MFVAKKKIKKPVELLGEKKTKKKAKFVAKAKPGDKYKKHMKKVEKMHKAHGKMKKSHKASVC